MEKFPEYIYTVDCKGRPYSSGCEGRTSEVPGQLPPYYMPTKENGKWDYRSVSPRHLDRTKFEGWKKLFYELEGWDPKTGWQTRGTLETLGLKNVANELENMGKLP